jgi:hypothetical protein
MGLNLPHLNPQTVAESFPLTPGPPSPPPVYSLPLGPPDGVKKPHWAPGPDYTRPIAVTASICLDFAMPSPFQGIDSRPALILAPARTWDPAIGSRMWEEVKQRANEIGSLALWCDGGKGGVSGVAGGGFNEIQQIGQGSWSMVVGFPYPFDPARTFYARFGDFASLAALWIFVIGPIGLWSIYRKGSWMAAYGACVDWFARKRRNPPPSAPQAQENLIDI